jgi:hypothetical protein
MWSSCGDDDDIGLSREFTEIWSLTIGGRDGGSGIDEHKGHGFPDDIGPADDEDVFPTYCDIVVGEECHDPFWGTTPESIVSEEHIPDLSLGKSVDIFGFIDTLIDRVSVDMIREGRLDDESMDTRIS